MSSTVLHVYLIAFIVFKKNTEDPRISHINAICKSQCFLSLFNLTNFKTHAWSLLILVAFRRLRQRLKLSLSGSVYASAYRSFMMTEKVQLTLSSCANDIFINMTCRRSILSTRQQWPERRNRYPGVLALHVMWGFNDYGRLCTNPIRKQLEMKEDHSWAATRITNTGRPTKNSITVQITPPPPPPLAKLRGTPIRVSNLAFFLCGNNMYHGLGAERRRKPDEKVCAKGWLISSRPPLHS
jgi:hypothetical protein